MIALSTLLLTIGLVLICLSMKRHFLQWLPNRTYESGPAQAARFSGYALVIAATAVLVRAEGWDLGLPLLCGIVPVVAFAISMATARRAQRQRGEVLRRRGR